MGGWAEGCLGAAVVDGSVEENVQGVAEGCGSCARKAGANNLDRGTGFW